MSDVLLFDASGPPSPRRVRIFLAEKGIEVPRKTVSLRDGEHFSDDYAKINPEHMVPALRIADGQVITESHAICRYFEELHPEPPLYGRNAVERARVEMWCQRIEREGYQAAASFLRNTNPRFEGRAIPGVREGWAQIEALGPRSRALFNRLLVRLDQQLGTTRFVASEVFTIADINLLVAMDFGQKMELTVPGNVQRWHDEVSTRPSASA